MTIVLFFFTLLAAVLFHIFHYKQLIRICKGKLNPRSVPRFAAPNVPSFPASYPGQSAPGLKIWQVQKTLHLTGKNSPPRR